MNFPTLYAPMGSPYAALTSTDSEAGGYGGGSGGYGGSSGGQRGRSKTEVAFNPFLVTTESDLDNAQWLGNTWIYQQEATQYLYVTTSDPVTNQPHQPITPHTNPLALNPIATRPSNPFLVTV